MKALIYQGPGKKSLEDRPVPEIIHATDAVIKITKTTIFGTDLHILKGDISTCQPGRILGHEGIGVVEQIGSGVTGFKKGVHVLISCITSCSKCDYCRKGIFSHCVNGGWILGNSIDGTQAKYVQKKINPTLLISHHFKFEDIIDAYETFGNAATHALKLIIDVG